MFQFKNYRTRLLIFLVSLLCLVLGAVLFSVNQANISNARLHLEEALQITANTFAKSLKDREQILTEKVRLLSGDFAFKTAFASRDPGTIKSALENHRQRVGANIMLLLSIDGETIADTLHSVDDKAAPSLNDLLKLAMNGSHGEASAIQIIDGRVHARFYFFTWKPRRNRFAKAISDHAAAFDPAVIDWSTINRDRDNR